MNILSIQSAVAFGHVGNMAAVFPLQRLGHTVWPVNTVNFSNHTGYPTVHGPVFSAQQVSDVLAGMEDQGVFEQVDVVLSGYLGTADMAEVVVDAVGRVKQANPAALYVADPVMGDHLAGIFVADDIPGVLRKTVLPAADIAVPNQFELNLLTGGQQVGLEETLGNVDKLRATGPDTVVVTSVLRSEDTLEMLAVNGDEQWVVDTPRLPGKIVGTGDMTSALVAGHSHTPLGQALGRIASTMYDVIHVTHHAGADELQIVPHQNLIVRPHSQFEARRI